MGREKQERAAEYSGSEGATTGGPLVDHAGGEDERLEALGRVSVLLTRSSDPTSVIVEVLDEVGALFSADKASLFLYSDGSLDYKGGFGFSDYFKSQVTHLSRTNFPNRLMSPVAEPFCTSDLRSYLPPTIYHDLLLSEGVSALCSSPLLSNSGTIGFLAIYHNAPYSYASSEIHLLQILAGIMSLAYTRSNSAATRLSEEQTRDRFLNALSHELRTPLTSIMGFVQVIRKRLSTTPNTDARLLDQLEVLWTQAQRLNRLIDTFVDLANIERGEFAINLGKVELNSLLRTAVSQSVAQARTRHIVDVQTPVDELWVHGDGKRLEQVFTHIVSNAIRYSPQDEPISVICEDHLGEGKVLVSITDHGPGVPAGQRTEVFRRSSPSEAQRAGGLGVGLYISKTIVEAHGGTISLESSPNSGTTVLVVLPA
ncbi:MAG: GAF domain-containing sensor histidine kinase [Chloroflexota bacterium]|nr:GAF domain-containing sensor histidine kinase [Chloroflexota bacterium]